MRCALRIGLLAFLAWAHSHKAEFQYDNEIAGEPDIECGYGVVHFKVHTVKGQPSQVFVKGNANNPDCAFHNTGNVTIELSKCNIRRKREANPSGVTYAMTVIVQLHPLFVTKVDRAYNVNCFYMEKKQDVNIEFGVSELTTQMVASDAVLPTCQYSIHRDSPNGPTVQYSRVGEVIYHKWECPSPMYKMLLSYCKVVDGKGKEYPLLDESGCSLDRFLFPEITYSDDVTTAMVETSAFNFPDQNQMYFSCKIQLCYMGDHCESITPPRCGSRHQIDASSTESSVELAGHGDEGALSRQETETDELISSSTQEALEKSTERAFEGDSEASTAAPPTSTGAPTGTSSSSAAPTSSAASASTSSSTSTTSTTAKPSSSSSAALSSTTSAAPSTVKQSSSTKLFIPADFPRPDSFEEASGEQPAVDAWMVSDIPEATENRNETETTAPPVQVLKKTRKRAPQAQKPQPTTPRSASRQQRDATPMPRKLVDFDVASPELTIMNVEDTTAETGSQAQRQIYRDLNLDPFSRGICFSPAALGCALALLLLLFVSVVFVMFRFRRHSATKYYSA